ncbi:PH domain-containing protein [Jiella sp. MQZ9-1]|uniref:PH domain-containing protein n=1 Tax=Jiella flava TaxID=2816857 RepID=A0A939FTS4_9HYPH|nr:PH domain-containing protein [Jiella flava]MBO0661275.1 PH domain-containing protein [Jiella flava]MCD2469920.1 PH domain-containing protein [Jiella flava]
MGLLSGLMGLTSDVDVETVRSELEPILVSGEEIELAFMVVRDMLVFTDLRLIMVDKQGMTGRKRNITSIPYRAISTFSIETAGTFDVDSEMTIWISGQPPLHRELSRRSNIAGIQKALAEGVLGRR